MSDKKTSPIDKSFCSNMYCPRDEQLAAGELPISLNTRNPLTLPKGAMHKDANGNYWCPLPSCERRYELIQWGAARNWPAIQAGKYAIGHDWELWKVAIMMGDEESIATYHAALFPDEEVQV